MEARKSSSVYATVNGDLKKHLADIELDCIKRAMAEAKNNRGLAARLLGIQRTTLVEKMKRYGIFKPVNCAIGKLRKKNDYQLLE